MPNGISYVSVGVADIEVTQALWVDTLGLEIVARHRGPDPELGKMWQLPAEQFVDQLLLRTPGATTGQLHFVQFAEPGEAVRKGAAPTDLGPKNLDVNCVGMPELVASLRQSGHSFRSDISEYEVDGIRVREVQMPAHDHINIVFIEILSQGFEVEYSAKGYAALTSFVVIVPSTLEESQFYQRVFGFDEIMHHRMAGPAIEAVIGLPAGAALDMRLLGKPDNLFGRMELIEYEDLPGTDRFARARPPATGILRCGFQVDSIERFVADASDQDVQVGGAVDVDVIFGAGRFVELTSPAGLAIEVMGSE